MKNYIEIPLELYRDVFCYFNAAFIVHKSYTNMNEKTIITEWGFKNADKPTLRYEKINEIEKYYLHYE